MLNQSQTHHQRNSSGGFIEVKLVVITSYAYSQALLPLHHALHLRTTLALHALRLHKTGLALDIH